MNTSNNITPDNKQVTIDGDPFAIQHENETLTLVKCSDGWEHVLIEKGKIDPNNMYCLKCKEFHSILEDAQGKKVVAHSIKK